MRLSSWSSFLCIFLDNLIFLSSSFAANFLSSFIFNIRKGIEIVTHMTAMPIIIGIMDAMSPKTNVKISGANVAASLLCPRRKAREFFYPVRFRKLNRESAQGFLLKST